MRPVPALHKVSMKATQPLERAGFDHVFSIALEAEPTRMRVLHLAEVKFEIWAFASNQGPSHYLHVLTDDDLTSLARFVVDEVP